ncbi:MAG: hypothetical protein K2Q06_10435, partial [Parvularculaceae bacterium]|nr:hypothetical protein [Parvularculaceae bacterium]
MTKSSRTRRARAARKPMDAKGIADVMAMLLLLTAIMHAWTGATASASVERLPMLAFAVLFAVSAFLVRNGRTGIMVAMIFPAMGLALGIPHVLRGGAVSLLTPVMFAIDVALLLLGIVWLR